MNVPVRLALVLLLSVAGCASEATSCDLDRALTAEVAGRAKVNRCEAFFQLADGGADAAAAQMALAQKCVLDAVAAKQAFTFEYEDNSQINHQRIGLAGVPDASGRMVVANYVYTGNKTAGVPGDGAPQLSRRSCFDSDTQSCLSCNNTAGGLLLCGG